MKKIVNKVDDYIVDMLDGIAYENSDIAINKETQIIYKKNVDKNKVQLISGGGSGHEPAHGGFVGKGMLDAAICGMVFTSPTPEMITDAIEKTKGDKGTLLVVKNYTGDVLNFEIAANLAKESGHKIEHVVVNDDVAVQDSLYTTGRRGIAGTIFVHKIAGAAAEDGKSLEEVKTVAEKVIANVRSMGMSFGGATIPADGKKSFELGEKEIEIGLGIHGEPGISKEKVSSSKEIVKKLLDKIVHDNVDFKGSKVAVMVNGLGGTPASELYIANKDAIEYLKDFGAHIAFNNVGNYMTSLEMPGFSISVLKLDDELEKYLKAPAHTKGWI